MSSAVILDLQEGVPHLDAILAGITHVHACCIDYDHTIATFLPPLSFGKILRWWQERFGETKHGYRRIWVELQPISSRKSQHESPLTDNVMQPIVLDDCPSQGYEVAGVVALQMPVTETGPFRGEVHKLLVSPNHRRKGTSRRLMAELEGFALKQGRWNLMLDTEVGSLAEQVYPRLGYVHIGIVPDYGYSPAGGKMCNEVWFYKDLRKGTL